MPVIITILKSLFHPYWEILRKRLAEEKIAPLTIAHAPNLLGHPIGILVLCLLGVFSIPSDPRFFLYWFMLVVMAGCSAHLTTKALLKTHFFAVQVVSSFGFAVQSIFAVIFLNETLSVVQIGALLLAAIGVLFFIWKKAKDHIVRLDWGIIYILIAVFFASASLILYKVSVQYVGSYTEFLSGRFVADLITWTLIWLVSMTLLKRNPLTELKSVYTKKIGLEIIVGISIFTLVGSWVVYKLPVTTLALLGTLSFPVAYFISKKTEKEAVSVHMWIGSICIILATILFLSN